MEPLTTISIGEPYMSAFAELISGQDLDDLEQFMTYNTFDEVPIYADYDQLGFMENLSVAEQNVLLIRASALHLVKIETFAENYWRGRADNHLRMVSLLTWWDCDEQPSWVMNDGSKWLLSPHFWVSSTVAEEMRNFKTQSPASVGAHFVIDALGGDTRFHVREDLDTDREKRYLDRVFITYSPDGNTATTSAAGDDGARTGR
jgi:hypothetical protein